MFLDISGISIELVGLKEISAPFALFQDNPKSRISDIRISLEPKPFYPGSHFKEDNLISQAKGLWAIYNYQGKLIFKDIFNRRVSNGDSRICSWDKDSGVVKLYLNGNSPLGRPLNPLAYPLGPLILLNKLGQKGEFFLHASGVKCAKDEGLVFCGNSGSGKSTMARIWLKNRSGTVLNDDRIIVRRSQGRFIAYGCPWYLKSKKLVSHEKLEIRKLFFLRHSKHNYVKPIEKKAAFWKLIRQAYFPVWDKEAASKSISFIQDLSQELRCFELGFRPTPEIIDFIRNIR